MGGTQSQLDDTKNTISDGDARLAFAASCVRGWRAYMEDFHTAILRLPHREFPHSCPHVYVCTIPAASVSATPVSTSVSVSTSATSNIHQTPYTFTCPLFDPEMHFSFFGVFDGHRGNKASHFVSRRLHWRIASETAFKAGDYPLAIENGFLFLDAELRQGTRFFGG